MTTISGAITALEFDERRAELIRLHEENPGKRGYGETTTKLAIGELLGFKQLYDRWKLATQHDCPIDRSYIRQSYLRTFTSPGGQYAAELNLNYGNTWKLNSPDPWTASGRLLWPDQTPGTVQSCIMGVLVFDSAKVAQQTAIFTGLSWVNEEMVYVREVVKAGETQQLPGDCPITKQDADVLYTNLEGLEAWLLQLQRELGISSSDDEPEQAPPARTVTDSSWQGFIFPDAAPPEEIKDLKLEEAEKLLEKATMEEEVAKDAKSRATKIHKTKERQLHYAEVLSIIEKTRVESLNHLGKYFVAADVMDTTATIRGKSLRSSFFDGAVFYGAFVDGCPVPLDLAREADVDEESRPEETAEDDPDEGAA